MTQISPSLTVRRRQVFYIPGYDPFPPRRYRELYRKESAEQSVISGYEIAVTGRTDGSSGWDVATTIDGQSVQSRLDVLTWSDLVQSSMSPSILRSYLCLFQTAWIYISTGALWRLVQLRKGPVIAALYPVVFLLAQLGIAVLFGRIAARITGLLLSNAALGLAVTALAAIATLQMFRRFDHKFFAYYLMHDYAFTAQCRGAYPQPLEERLTSFRQQIAAALASDVDEVLVVGHSSGAHLAISVLADLIPAQQDAPRPALALLTLGQVVPMVSFLPDAQRLRSDLHCLSSRAEVTWIDVSAPGDGCCFALCDPVSVTGVAPEIKHGPLVFSAAFSQTLSAERWDALKRRYFRLHFQYLCAFDRPRDYDYFQITAGPLTLADRFHGRSASKSRIERPLSGYRDRASP